MVSRKTLLIAAAAAMTVVVGLLPATASAFPNNHLVGDLDGWDPDVNFEDWALSVSINAGDTLQFVYNENAHNVVMVDEDGYNACDATNNLGTWNSGNDFVQLPAEPGDSYFICDMADYCTQQDMKLAITAV